MIACLLAAAAAAPQEPAEAPPAPPPVVRVSLQGPLSESWAPRLERARQTVQASGAGLFILELDTPGGEVELMKRLADTLDEIGRDTETVAYVTHRAWSAGAFLAVGCRQIWMAPGASIGAAMPVSIGPGGLIPDLDEDYQEKVLAAFRAEFRAWAETHGRNPVVAEAFVDSSVELKQISLHGEIKVVSGQEFDDLIARGEEPVWLKTLAAQGQLLALTVNEARDLDYCDGSAPGVQELIAGLGFGGAPVLEVGPNWSEDLVDFIGGLSWLLLLGAAFFLVVAFNMPGLGAPEVAAAICFILYLFHHYLVGLAEWTDVILVVGGMGLLFVEVFLAPGTLVPGVAGAVLLLLGLFLSMQDFVIPQGRIEMRTFRSNLATLLGVALLLPLVGTFAVRRFARSRAGAWIVNTPTRDFSGPAASLAGASGEGAGSAVQAGDSGICLTDLRPAGRVEVGGAPLDARSSGGYLEAGTTIRVLRLEGGTLVVGPAEENA